MIGVGIGMDLGDIGFSEKDVLDENNVKLSEWFVQEGDSTVYLYDFGDDWSHEVVLESVLEKVAGENYPQCVKAVGVAPEEDSRGMMDEKVVKEINWQVLTKKVNKALAEIGGKMVSLSDETFDWKRLFEEAKEFNKLKPWDHFGDNQIFVVVDPLSGENLYCSVLGAMGEEFGLAVYIGQEGLQSIRDTYKRAESPLEIFFRQRSLLLSFVNRDELEKNDYELIKSQGLTFRGKKQWVQFRSMLPGSYPWAIDEEEARMLLVVIEQAKVVVELVRKGFVIPVIGDESSFFARIPVERGGSIVWDNDVIPVKEKRAQFVDFPLVISELDVARAKKYERRNSSIEFDLFYVDFPFQEAEGVRPSFPMMAAAIDRKTGLVSYQNIFEGTKVSGNAQQALLEFIEIEGFRPRELWVTEKMKAMLAPIINPLRIEVMAVENLENIESVKEFLSRMKNENSIQGIR